MIFTAGEASNPPVLFLHGTSGSAETFRKVISDPELQARFHLIAIDRPGYGGSGAGKAVVSHLRQAEMAFAALVSNRSGRPAIIVAYSYAGGIAGRMAVEHPERVAALLLIAPSMSPELEKMKWYETASQWKVLRRVLPKAWVVGGAESKHNPEQLEAFQNEWQRIRGPVHYIQGLNDKTVSPRTADFAQSVLLSADLSVSMIPNVGHELPVARPDILIDDLLALSSMNK